MSNTPTTERKTVSEHEAIHIIETVSAYFRNDITEKVANESVRNSIKRIQANAVDEALKVVFKSCRIEDVATDTIEQWKNPKEFLKQKIISNLK